MNVLISEFMILDNTVNVLFHFSSLLIMKIIILVS